MRKAKSKLLRAGRKNALTMDEHRRHFSQRRVQHECRSKQNRGAMQDAAERVRERAVGDGPWRSGVEHAGGAIASDQPRHHRRPVVDVHPRHELIARPERCAEAELERQQHLAERAAIAIERQAGANDRDCALMLTRPCVLPLPIRRTAAPESPNLAELIR